MKYLITFITLSACGVWAASTHETASITGSPAVETGNSGGKNLARITGHGIDVYNQPSYTHAAPLEGAPSAARSPIPALILPNNVCVINTDLSPDRSIEDHILACVHAQRIRQSIPR